MSEAIKTGEKDGIILEEYKGNYSLISMREGSDGKFWKQYATYQTGKDKHAEKDWPVKVALGSKETAIAAVKTILKELGGSAGGDDDVPF